MKAISNFSIYPNPFTFHKQPPQLRADADFAARSSRLIHPAFVHQQEFERVAHGEANENPVNESDEDARQRLPHM